MDTFEMEARRKSLKGLNNSLDDMEAKKLSGLTIQIPGATLVQEETPDEPEGPGEDLGIGDKEESPFMSMLRNKKQEQMRGM